MVAEQVWDRIWVQPEDQIYRRFNLQIDHSVWDQVVDLLEQQIEVSVWDGIRGTIRDEFRAHRGGGGDR